MNIKIENGMLTVSLFGLMDSVTDIDTLTEIVDALSCHDLIIDYVAAQVFDGYTPQQSHGARMAGMPEPCTALDRLRRRIALESPMVGKKEIEDMERRFAALEVLMKSQQRENIELRRKLGERI